MQRYACLFIALILLLTGLGAFADTPKAVDARAFTFAVFGDNRPNQPGSRQPAAFRKVLTEMDAMHPDFAVNTGDCVYGSSDVTKLSSQYKDYLDTVATLTKTKVYLALGNHEIHGTGTQGFFKRELGALYYSFDVGDSHFIVLDSEVVGQAGRVMGEQLDWLRDDLHKSRAARHKFVFFHRPMYPVDGHLGNSMDQYPKDRDQLHSLFVRNRIEAVFTGHEHLFNAQYRNGVRYFITGGGGAFVSPSYVGEGDFHHFMLVSVDDDKVTMRVVKIAERGHPSESFEVK